MPRDLYEDLSKIEDRGKRLKASNSRTAERTVPSENRPRPGPPLVLSASRAARPTAQESTSERAKAPDGNNGGPLEKNPYVKRDIYADLERIEERGKRTKDKRSILGRRKE